MELISVIIPVYNVEAYLDECLESVVGQTYKNFQIILIDDGSTDNSSSKCDEWAAKDDRITVIHQQNSGLSAARNIGIKNSKGAWITFIDSDDMVTGDYIRNLYDLVTEYSSDLGVCSYYSSEENSNVQLIQSCDNSHDAVAKLIEDKEIHNFAWGKIYRRELFDDITFPVGKKYEDVHIMAGLFMRCRSVAYSNKQLYFYRQRQDSILHKRDLSLNIEQLDAYRTQRIEVCTKWPEFQSALDQRDYPFLISTLLYYYRQYRHDERFENTIKDVIDELKECRNRLKNLKLLTFKDEVNYIRTMKIEPLVRR